MRRKLKTISSRKWSRISILLTVVFVFTVLATVVLPQRLGAQFGFITIVGFRVNTTLDGSLSSADTAWESASGGALAVEISDQAIGSDSSDHVIPGRTFITDLVLSGPVTGGPSNDTQLLQNGAGHFIVEIDNLPNASMNVLSISIDPITVDRIDIVSSADESVIQYNPGAVQYGQIVIDIARSGDDNGILEWWSELAEGHGVDQVGKMITLSGLSREGDPLRTWTFHEAIPVSYSPLGGGFGIGSPVASERVVLVYSRFEMMASGNRAPIANHFSALIDGAPIDDATFSITEIFTDGSDGRVLTYIDAFPVKYVFPEFSASGSGDVREEIHYLATQLQIE